jgi:acyl dehydratase
MTQFDPAAHRTHAPRPFAEFRIGEVFRAPSRTMTEGVFAAFQAAIGASPLAHQMGEALIGFIAQSSRFLAPVYCGDTLYPAFEIIRLEPRSTTGVLTVAITIHKQDGTLVCDGEQSYLMRL